MSLFPALAGAQEPPPVPSSVTEPQGMVPEPDVIIRATLFANRHLGKGDLTNGLYVDFANMIPGAGWLSAGPGYRRWYKKDAVFVDASAAMSWNGYKMAQARLELPKFAKSRLALGTQWQWQDFSHVDYFGEGPLTAEDARAEYGVKATQLAAYATLRPIKWLALGGRLGWMNPEMRQQTGSPLFNLTDTRTFVPAEVSLTIDARDFPDNPTRGALVRAAGTRFTDRDGGAFTFDRYEAELAGFVPIGGGRVVLAMHGWLVGSETKAGQSVPFYLQPSLGGANALRSFTDYRYHDRNMLVGQAELRLALMTHMAVALFADAGNVAREVRDLDLAKRSFGAGVRFHTRSHTYAVMDVAKGDEGWRVLFRLRDPLQLGRLARRALMVPFVP